METGPVRKRPRADAPVVIVGRGAKHDEIDTKGEIIKLVTRVGLVLALIGVFAYAFMALLQDSSTDGRNHPQQQQQRAPDGSAPDPNQGSQGEFVFEKTA